LSLSRTPEPPPSDLKVEAFEYEMIDHTLVNRVFVDDLIAGGPVGPQVIDLGCGPGMIAIEICERNDEWVVMGIDSSIPMLDAARMQIDFAGMLDRVFLEHADITDLRPFGDQMANTVVSNTVLHHLEDPVVALHAAVRLVCGGGRIFIRDLARPETEQDVEQLVAKHTVGQTPQGQQLLRQSLHAALTLAEIQEICLGLGIGNDDVQMTSDRHWTIDWQRPAD
jgi:ubiquinone/menaquinone biosynthesis C-methylase UbiE